MVERREVLMMLVVEEGSGPRLASTAELIGQRPQPFPTLALEIQRFCRLWEVESATEI